MKPTAQEQEPAASTYTDKADAGMPAGAGDLTNPYCLNAGGTEVKIEFAPDAPSLQEMLTAFLIRQKSGL